MENYSPTPPPPPSTAPSPVPGRKRKDASRVAILPVGGLQGEQRRRHTANSANKSKNKAFFNHPERPENKELQKLRSMGGSALIVWSISGGAEPPDSKRNPVQHLSVP